ncbi:actin-binding protein IPP [Bacillus rossius redtenbacheri]|uniref:actin-binding protein IPP n=1 Tax=Bacillus rossius redtenbacheri TaxID=93214 RepID=UPI002FDE1150
MQCPGVPAMQRDQFSLGTRACEGRSQPGTDRLFSHHKHASHVMASLGALREDARFCDVELVAQGTAVKAHRAVLCASSPYFHAMFTAGLSEEQKDTVELHAVSASSLKSLVEFIYTGETVINQDNVQELMVAADMLQLREVVLGCCEYLRQELHCSNALGIFRFAEAHNFTELASEAEAFIRTHFPGVSGEQEFLDLPRDLVVRFLECEHLRVDSESQVFRAALRWLLHDVSQRRGFVFHILPLVRLPLLSMRELEQAIDSCQDESLKVALSSARKNILSKGSPLNWSVEPRLGARRDIFVIGGSKRELVRSWTRSCECTFDSVERFDPYRRKWHGAAPMGVGRILPGVALLRGNIFAVGGELDSQILADVESYSPREDRWTRVASMVVPRCEFGLCALEDRLYALGGWVGEDIGASIEQYDPCLDEWTLQSSMPEPRFSMGVVSHQGLIYVVGGCTHAHRQMQDLLSFNPVTGEWTTLAPMTVSRSQMGVAVLHDHLYVVGGHRNHHEVLQCVERYSFHQNKWSEVPPMKVPRASPAVAAVDGLLYVIGGDQNHDINLYRAHVTVDTVECYDPATQTWDTCPPLPESRSEAGAVVV